MNEYDLETGNKPSIEQRPIAKASLGIKSKSSDNIRAVATTIVENGKTKLVCPRDQKKVNKIN